MSRSMKWLSFLTPSFAGPCMPARCAASIGAKRGQCLPEARAAAPQVGHDAPGLEPDDAIGQLRLAAQMRGHQQRAPAGAADPARCSTSSRGASVQRLRSARPAATVDAAQQQQPRQRQPARLPARQAEPALAQRRVQALRPAPARRARSPAARSAAHRRSSSADGIGQPQVVAQAVLEQLDALRQPAAAARAGPCRCAGAQLAGRQRQQCRLAGAAGVRPAPPARRARCAALPLEHRASPSACRLVPSS